MRAIYVYVEQMVEVQRVYRDEKSSVETLISEEAFQLANYLHERKRLGNQE